MPADLTAGSVKDLALRFQGQAAAQGSSAYDAATGTYTVVGAGTDIWGNADQFTYVYKSLQGDGAMVARVTNIGPGTNTWAKAGVMIRENLTAGSTHASMDLSANTDGAAGNGYSFQRRLVADLASTGDNGVAPALKPPYWVKIERKGDVFSGSISPDGQTWTVFGTPQTIVMKDPVFIGLCATSHQVNQERTMTFDSVSTTGNVVPDGAFTTWKVINTTQNAILPLYAAIEDKAGKIAMVTHPNPKAVSQSNISTGTT
ncbi:MAG: hypothetical protein MUC88_07145, partial [Planctomycetes bacterium]|nr:hypothetical protein [Planctomycetota bacterium]